MEDIAEFVEAIREIEKSKDSKEIKAAALGHLTKMYNVLCESKEPTLCVVCADPRTDVDERGMRLLATAVIDGAYFDLVNGHGMNKEAADSFIYGSNLAAKNVRKTWHDIAGITTPEDMEIETRVINWRQAHG